MRMCLLLGLSVAGCVRVATGELELDGDAIDMLIVDVPEGDLLIEPGPGLTLAHETRWRGDTPPDVQVVAQPVDPEVPVRRTRVSWVCFGACRTDAVLVAPPEQSLYLASTARIRTEITGLTGNVFLEFGGAGNRLDLHDLEADVFARSGFDSEVELRRVAGRVEIEAGRVRGEGITGTTLNIVGRDLVGLSFDVPPRHLVAEASAGEVIVEVPASEYRIEAAAPDVTLDGLSSVPDAPRVLDLRASERIVVRLR